MAFHHRLWIGPGLLVLLGLLAASTAAAEGQAHPQQEAAIRALRGVASNIQKNRDGTVRFVRFSRPTVSDEHVRQLLAFKQLDYLAIVTPTVNDSALRQVVGALSQLDTLVLSDSSATDATMPAAAQCRKLEHLFLDRTAIGDAGLRELAELPQLRTLSLCGTQITDKALGAVGELRTLEVLRLSDTTITDNGLRHLAGLKSLRQLLLDGTQVTGHGLGQLQDCEQLQVISLDRCPLDAARLRSWHPPQTLRLLSLRATGIAAAEVDGWLPAKTQTAGVVGIARQRDPWRLVTDGRPLRGAPQPLLPPLERVPADSQAGAEIRQQRRDDTPAAPDFQRHVIPLLGRLGCNGRTCHGSFQGRGGLRLSMFGYDFAADHQALVSGEEPRVDLRRPAESLMLYKPTHGDEHGGGQRLQPGSWQYNVLHDWIAGGTVGTPAPAKLRRLEVEPRQHVFAKPGQQIRLRCVAVWDNEAREDVTSLARFQSNDPAVAAVEDGNRVRCVGPGDTHVVAYYDSGVFTAQFMLPVSDRVGRRFPDLPTPTRIDQLTRQKWSQLGLVPSALCSDEAYLRRVSLDLAGTLPTPREIRRFLADRSPDKRQQAVERLLESAAYVQWWTVLLSDLTGSNAQYLGSTDMNQPAASQWNAWIARRLQDNVGWDRIAAGILLATSRRPGQDYVSYAAEQSSYLRRSQPRDYTALDNPMHYYWFRSNNQLPADRALAFAYTFLGVRLQCVQCHKHPFDRWSQAEFQQFAEFFTRIKAGVAPDAKPLQDLLKTKLGVPQKLDTAALRRQMYLRVSAEGLPIPWNETWIEPPGRQPQPARLLGGPQLDLSRFEDPREPLVRWLLRPDNPYFARAMVNRVWRHYFGTGIVEPPDDFNLANPPSNQPLLDYLSGEFVRQNYDLKWLHRTITASRTYQLSWRTNPANAADRRHFSHGRVRRLPAEVTVDALLQATANDQLLDRWLEATAQRKIAQHPKSIQARGIDYSLLIFGKPLRTTNCDCQRESQPTLLQSLYVRNDAELLRWLQRPDGWLQQLSSQWNLSLSAEGAAAVRPPRGAPAPPEDLRPLVESAYLRTVSRMPSEAERAASVDHLSAAENVLEGLRDLLWALVNTHEFLTNH